MAQQAIGMIECKGLISLMEASDAALKSADVSMTGWEKIGSGLVTGFYTGDVAAVKAAVEAGQTLPVKSAKSSPYKSSRARTTTSASSVAGLAKSLTSEPLSVRAQRSPGGRMQQFYEPRAAARQTENDSLYPMKILIANLGSTSSSTASST